MSIDVIVARQYPDYHDYGSQMVSELMAFGAPTRALLVWLFMPYNLLMLAFAGGVWACADGSRSFRFTAAALLGYAVVSLAGLLLFPMNMRGGPKSEQDILHIAATIVMSLLIVTAMALGAFTQGKRFRLYTFGTIAAVLVFGAWAGLLSRPMPGPTPGLGWAERINIYVTMVWFGVLAIGLQRLQHSRETARKVPLVN